MLEIGGAPADWICRGGAPSVAGRDMPSFESEDGKLHVYDFMPCQLTVRHGAMLFSRWYGEVARCFPEGMLPLHHNPGAMWVWRPRIYTRFMGAPGWTFLGSQHELAWRYGLAQTMVMTDALRVTSMLRAMEESDEVSDEDFQEIRGALDLEGMIEDLNAQRELVEAENRAIDLLLDCLTPQQRIEYRATSKFRVRGAKTCNVYEVEIGNGFGTVDRLTGEKLVSYCFHPEGWIPHEDVALATKFALEDEELEVEFLENAKMVVLDKTLQATHEQIVAARYEDQLVRA